MSNLISTSIPLRFCTYEIFPARKLVRTTFPNGAYCDGTREDNEGNRREAESQGYKGDNIVWRSLVDHELLHSLIPEMLFDHPSSVLLTESGQQIRPLYERYQEETLCLVTQQYLRIRQWPETLFRLRVKSLLDDVVKYWDSDISPILSPLYDE